MIKKPLIGITLDAEEPGGYTEYPWYALRENYCSSITNAGGVPFPLTHDLTLVSDYLSLIDGLVITGGSHDIDPTLYGIPERHATVTLKPQRTTFEMAIAKAVLNKNLPLLGICGGHQVINVALGGTLIQHIPDEVPNCLEHVQKNTRYEPWHTVTILKETRLYKIIGTDEIDVNSGHHQAIQNPGKECVINALAPDGVIEGFEAPQYRFCLGIQWHPEFIVTPYDALIFKAFIESTHE